MMAYEVTTHDNTYTVDAKTEADARSKVCNEFNVEPDKIVDVDKLERKINLVVSGEINEIESVVEDILEVIDNNTADVEYRSNDSIIEDFPDENAQRIAVDRWDDIIMRITGLDDHVDGDGVDVSPDIVACDNSVVEVIVHDEVILRSIKQ